MTGASSQSVTVHFATENGSATDATDFVAASGDLTFDPGESAPKTKTITVSILGDALKELTKSFALNLSNPVNAVFANSKAIGTILDND